MGTAKINSLSRIRSLDNGEQAIVGNFLFIIRGSVC